VALCFQESSILSTRYDTRDRPFVLDSPLLVVPAEGNLKRRVAILTPSCAEKNLIDRKLLTGAKELDDIMRKRTKKAFHY